MVNTKGEGEKSSCLLYTSTAYNVKLEVSKTTTVTVPDEEQLGQLTVYKEGEVLTGADVTENVRCV